MAFQNNNQYDNLIKQASSQSGTNPQELKNAIDSGKLDELLKKMNPRDAQKFNEIINNKALAEQMLKTPQAQALIKSFMGKK